MHFVSLSDCPPQPWRNGGGTTRELLRWPAPEGGDGANGSPNGSPNDSADDWLVRVSVAEITRDGPFSPYPGIDRWFAVLSGAGVRLVLPDGEREQRPGAQALAFAGEAAPGCTLIDGVTSDLNLMVRRGSGPASRSGLRAVMRLARPGSMQRGRQPWRALYAATACRLRIDDEWHDLPAGTLAWSDAQRAETWELGGERSGEAEPGMAFWMSFEP